MAVFCSDKKCSISSKVMFFVSCALVLWIIWFGAASFLGKGAVESRLQQLAVQLAQTGSKDGKDIKLTYGAIDIEGWGYKKQAIVRDLAVEFSDKNKQNSPKNSFSAKEAIVNIDPLNPGKIAVSVAGPVAMAKNGKNLKEIAFSEPLTYSYMQDAASGGNVERHDVVFPVQITIDNAGAADKEASGNGGVVVDFSRNPVLQYTADSSKNSSSLLYDLSGLTLNSADKTRLTVGEWKGEVSSVAGEAEGLSNGKYSLSASNIVFNNGVAITKPYKLEISTDALISTQKPEVGESEHAHEHDHGHDHGQANEQAVAESVETQEVTINNIVLSNPDFKINVGGKYSLLPGDPLPSGEITVDIDNLPQFLDSEIVALQGRKIAEDALTQITGQSVDGQASVSFLVKRARGGSVYIGGTTFEQLIASLLASNFPLPSSGVSGRHSEVPHSPGKPENDAVFGGDSSASAPVASEPAPAAAEIKPAEDKPAEGADSIELPVTAPKP